MSECDKTSGNVLIGSFAPMTLPDLPKKPLVSVLVSNYNYRAYIGLAIESVMNQTYTNFELIICDDGSKDGSCEVIKPYTVKDNRVKLISRENRGQAAALNTAYESSKGDIVCFLDSDDVFFHTKLEKVVAAFVDNKKAGYCIHFVAPVSGDGQKIREPIPKRLESGWIGCEALKRGGKSYFPPTSGLSFRREITDKVLPLPAKFRICADGYLREAAQFITEIVPIPEVLADYRIHGGNLRGSYDGFQARMKKVVLEEYPDIFGLVKDFLYRTYGDDVTRHFHLEDSITYWESFFMFRVMEGKQQGGDEGCCLDEILTRLEKSERRRFWNFIAKLPRAVARPTLEFCLGASPARQMIMKVVNLIN